MDTDYMNLGSRYNIPFEVTIEDQRVSKQAKPEESSSTLIWYTHGSKTIKGTGAGYMGYNQGRYYFFPKYPKVFQAEIYVILQCADEIKRKAYKGKQIYIDSDSQTALKALEGHKVSSRLVWEYQWVPGRERIPGNEKPMICFK